MVTDWNQIPRWLTSVADVITISSDSFGIDAEAGNFDFLPNHWYSLSLWREALL
jgi:hypothetical protein